MSSKFLLVACRHLSEIVLLTGAPISYFL